MASLRDLSLVDPRSLTQEFKDDLESLKTTVLNHIRAKQANMREQKDAIMTGQQLAGIITFLTHNVNYNTFPKVPSLFESWIVELSDTAKKDTLQSFSEKLEAVKTVHPPVPRKVFEKKYFEILAESKEFYTQLLFGFEKLYSSGLVELEVKSTTNEHRQLPNILNSISYHSNREI